MGPLPVTIRTIPHSFYKPTAPPSSRGCCCWGRAPHIAPLPHQKIAAWPLQCRISIALGSPLCCNGVFAAPAAITLWERDTMNRITAVVAGLSLAFVGTSATIAATINVPADQPTIAAAISASVNGDVINIASGTYIAANLKPDGKAITIQGTLNGDGSLATTIDAQNLARAFLLVSSETSTTVIKDLLITNGKDIDNGGAIYCDGASPTITNCKFTNNDADNDGGAIYLSSSSPLIEYCEFLGNDAGKNAAEPSTAAPTASPPLPTAPSNPTPPTMAGPSPSTIPPIQPSRRAPSTETRPKTVTAAGSTATEAAARPSAAARSRATRPMAAAAGSCAGKIPASPSSAARSQATPPAPAAAGSKMQAAAQLQRSACL